eukprot:CAMPEP_0196766706 /NCGR_PEP_ID=MMETSP1095-20130614/28946_1 /TAXON_ID=96789 ORGANISM="Chromulina nebulosa, Strain UTEXLB2642" /NCGR_SAMPLE_ID=MMETSP1095 /ASSEMBLY_ACC=CAM_ASM_000446 /LENGTH=74 /DNA_ID=CAMNT_0042130239 /DNA_START=1932 /DNA_END=2156 /DNA_ORIENTATION=+
MNMIPMSLQVSTIDGLGGIDVHIQNNKSIDNNNYNMYINNALDNQISDQMTSYNQLTDSTMNSLESIDHSISNV